MCHLKVCRGLKNIAFHDIWFNSHTNRKIIYQAVSYCQKCIRARNSSLRCLDLLISLSPDPLSPPQARGVEKCFKFCLAKFDSLRKL